MSAILKEAGVDTPEVFARIIQKGCFNESLQQVKVITGMYPQWTDEKFTQTYSLNLLNIITALKCDSSVGSSYLAEKIKTLSSETKDMESFLLGLAKQSPHSLAPEVTGPIYDEITRRTSTKLIEKISTMYKCPKCGGKETTYREKQTRSSDEMISVAVTCTQCRTSWIS